MLDNEKNITKDNLLSESKKLYETGARFVIATCVDIGDKFEMIYHFDKELKLTNLRLQFGYDEEIPSISTVFPAALLIESEVTDHFGAKIKGIAPGLILAKDSPKMPMRKAKKEGVV